MQYRKLFLCFLTLLILLSTLSTLVLGRSRIEGINNFTVYYGNNEVEELKKFDLAILSPLLEDEIRQLNNYGILTIAYVSLTTVGGWEPWAKDVSNDFVIGTYAEWGEKIVNACDFRWRNIMLNQAIPFILERGFKGVFLDNLDIVDKYPFMRNCVVGLVKDIRGKYPNIVIVVNRGFSIIEEIAPFIDAILFENFGTYYDFNTKQYRKWKDEDYYWMLSIAEKLEKLKRKYSITVLALGYADLNNETMLRDFCNYVSNLASKYGFIPYVGNAYLNTVNTKCLWASKNHIGEKGSTFAIVSIITITVFIFLLKVGGRKNSQQSLYRELLL